MAVLLRFIRPSVSAWLILTCVTACSSSLPTDRGYEIVPQVQDFASIKAGSYLTSAGCREQPGPRDSATIVFRLIGGGMARFTCPGVPRGRIKSAIGAYRDAVFRATGALASGGDDEFVYVHTYYSCDVTHYWDYYPSTGEYVHKYSTSRCTYWEVYDLPDNVTGVSTPAMLPLPNPVPAPDTACRKSGDIQPAGQLGAGQDGPLADTRNQQALRDLFAAARASNTEMGGYFYQETAGAPIKFQQLSADPSRTDACQFYSSDTGPALGHIVAYAHTHQAPENVPIWCPLRQQTIVPINSLTGGGSTQDWSKADNQQRPEFTIDEKGIWRLDPGTSPSQQTANTNHWTRQGNGCALHAT